MLDEYLSLRRFIARRPRKYIVHNDRVGNFRNNNFHGCFVVYQALFDELKKSELDRIIFRLARKFSNGRD